MSASIRRRQTSRHTAPRLCCPKASACRAGSPRAVSRSRLTAAGSRWWPSIRRDARCCTSGRSTRARRSRSAARKAPSIHSGLPTPASWRFRPGQAEEGRRRRRRRRHALRHRFSATGSWNRNDVILFTPKGNSPLFRVSARSGAPVAGDDPDRRGRRGPALVSFFLPDDRHFLYFVVGSKAGRTVPRGVYVGALDANAPGKLLVENATNAKYANGHLVFLRAGTLLAQPFDTERLELRGEAVPWSTRSRRRVRRPRMRPVRSRSPIPACWRTKQAPG